MLVACIGQLERPSVHEIPQRESRNGRLLLSASTHVALPAELRVLHDIGGDQAAGPRNAGGDGAGSGYG